MAYVLQQNVRQDWGKKMESGVCFESKTAAEYLFSCQKMNLPRQQADGDKCEPCRPAAL